MEKIVWGEAIEVNGKKPEWLGRDVRGLFENGYPENWLGSEETSLLGWGWSDGSDDSVVTPLRIKLPADHFAYTAIAQGFTPWGGGESAPEDWDGGPVLYTNGFIQGEGEAYSWIAYDWAYRGDSGIIGYRKRAATGEDFLATLPTLAPEVPAMATKMATTPDQLIADFYQKFGTVAGDTPRHIRILDALADIDETTVVVKRMSEVEWEKLATDWFLAGKGAPIIGYALQVIGKLGLIANPTPIERFAAENPGIVNDENRHWFELALEWGR